MCFGDTSKRKRVAIMHQLRLKTWQCFFKNGLLRLNKHLLFYFNFFSGGLTLLALLSLIMDAFRIGYYVGYHSCVSAVLGVYPVIHATHTVAQVSLQANFHFNKVIIFQRREGLSFFLGAALEIMCSLLPRRVSATT